MSVTVQTNGATKTKNGTSASKEEIVIRKQSRPIGEFGGNIGCFLWSTYIPFQIYYFYGLVILGRGELLVPNAQFWKDLYYTLPAGLAIRPTWNAMATIAVWCVSQAVLELGLPSQPPFGYGITDGVTLKNGRRLRYQMNGLLAFFLTHLGCYALACLGIMSPAIVWEQMGALLTGGVIVAYVFALWLYIDFGLLWKRHTQDPEFEEDWGVFRVTDFFNDFFMGVARNPRILHGWFDVPLDLKRWWDGRTLTLWVLLNQSYVAAQYYGCTFDFDSFVTDGTMPMCEFGAGTWANVGWASILITAAHWYYVWDYNYCEPAYLTTTDIRHDLFGFMLTYGMFGFLAWYYPLSFLGFLSSQGSSPNGWITDNHASVCVGIGLYIIGMCFFRYTNIEKHNFRTEVARLQKEGLKAKQVDEALVQNYKIWGRPVDFIRTEEGSYLLCSGTWGLARHFNYIGDMVMCVGWAVACYSPNHPFPYVPISYCCYFWVMDVHRLFRDEHRCSVKYKKDWERYCDKVQWRIIPGVF